jgi:uncharacterized radical SAM superfamily Fe-S cluster-containing enzyme
MADLLRPYLFYDTAISLCSRCLRKVEGKIVFQDEDVFLLKRCPEHGAEKVLIADDIAYYRLCREVFIKPPGMPLRYNTKAERGCPYDCGICPEHEQHSCLTLIEICDHCELQCPVCYAASGPSRSGFRSLKQIEAMLDSVVANEAEPDVVQISGGEPTSHPDFFKVLDLARARPIKHLMVNTNGIRIAKDEEFARRLASYMPGFELYLQFDSLREAPLRNLRGSDLREVRRQALERLNRLGVSTTLVVTLKKGVNDDEVGSIVEFALQQSCVRGVVFQPIQAAGRLEGFDAARDRMTLTEVRRKILEQTTVFRPEDILPVPCHPDSLAMAYALKLGGKVLPLTGLIDPKVLIEAGRNTIIYEKDASVREMLFRMLSTNHSPQSGAASVKGLLCCFPQAGSVGEIGYREIFRILIMQFSDAATFDARSVKKSCVHIAHPDGRIIPFDTYNLFYRDGVAASGGQAAAT